MTRSKSNQVPSNNVPLESTQPDVIGWIAVGLSALVVVLLAWFKIGNLDLGYHIAYGRHFLETGNIVGFQPDPFLYAESRQPFVNANWGAQVIFAWIEGFGGAVGLFALRSAMIAVIFASMGHIVFRQTRRPLPLAFAWILAAMAGYERFSLRPELFSYAILSVQLVVLVGGVRTRWHVATLVGLQLLLVNMHSYFLLGVALTMCWAVVAISGMLVQRWSASLYSRNAATSGKCILVAFALQVVACCCHPWHVNAAAFPFRTARYLAQTDAMGGAGPTDTAGSWSNISEFQSPFSFFGESINRFTIDAFVLLLIVVVVGLVASVRQKRWPFCVAMLGFFIVATQMRRNIAPFAFIATPLAVVAIAAMFKRDDSKRRKPSMPGARARQITSVVLIASIISLLVLIGTGRWYFHERRITRQRGTGYSDVTFPHEAVHWISQQGNLTPELYVDYFASSNALMWLPSRFRLFVDTNTFAYSDTTLSEAFDAGLAKLPHNEFFDRNQVNVVMLHCGPDTQLLVRNLMRDEMAWVLVYFDKSVVIFIRRGIWAHTDVVLANPMGPQRLDADSWIASATGTDHEQALQLGTMANVPISLGYWSHGASICRKAVELAPDYHEAWLQLGTCYGNLGNSAARGGDLKSAVEMWRDAVACFERVIVLDAEDKTAPAMLERTRQLLNEAKAMRT